MPNDDRGNDRTTFASSRRTLPATLALLAAAAGIGITALLGAASAASPAAASATSPAASADAGNHGRCVGMFLDTTSGGGAGGGMLPSQVPADATNLVVRGTVPCRDQVFAWASRGTYRVFEDGTVQFLASPMPPCPKGDFYVWIEFPR